jgi:hypothetical protein
MKRLLAAVAVAALPIVVGIPAGATPAGQGSGLGDVVVDRFNITCGVTQPE